MTSATRRRRTLVAAVVCTALALLFGAAVVALAPRWINLDPVCRKVEFAASSALRSRIMYDGIDLSLCGTEGQNQRSW